MSGWKSTQNDWVRRPTPACVPHFPGSHNFPDAKSVFRRRTAHQDRHRHYCHNSVRMLGLLVESVAWQRRASGHVINTAKFEFRNKYQRHQTSMGTETKHDKGLTTYQFQENFVRIIYLYVTSMYSPRIMEKNERNGIHNI